MPYLRRAVDIYPKSQRDSYLEDLLEKPGYKKFAYVRLLHNLMLFESLFLELE